MTMQIAVLIEPMNGKGFRASGGEPFSITTEGARREEALNKPKDAVQARLKSGAEVVTLDLGPQEHPLLKFAGMFKDNPLVADWKQAMAEYRDQVEKDDDY
jgi:hypothetical protein